MKKFILMAMAAVAAVGLTGCSEDTDPKLGVPTEFVLNTPPMADIEYVLTPECTVNFTVSQPNYGVATTPDYTIQIAKSAEAFEANEFQTVNFSTKSAKIEVPGNEFALAMCSLYGYDSEENFSDEAKPVYVRCHAKVGAADFSEINSNVICLKSVKPYFAVQLPDEIWLVGQPEGWATEKKPEWALYETEVGSLIYEGTFEIPAGQFQFRFYDDFDASDPWNYFSIGAQNADNPVDITMTDGVYTGPCVYDPKTKEAGKGSWQISDWAGGMVQITVNLGTKQVKFQAL